MIIECQSIVDAPAERGWERVVTAEGINDELRPWINRWITPVIRRLLTALLGWRYDGSETARHRLVRKLPIVALRPRFEPDPSAR